MAFDRVPLADGKTFLFPKPTMDAIKEDVLKDVDLEIDVTSQVAEAIAADPTLSGAVTQVAADRTAVATDRTAVATDRTAVAEDRTSVAEARTSVATDRTAVEQARDTVLEELTSVGYVALKDGDTLILADKGAVSQDPENPDVVLWEDFGQTNMFKVPKLGADGKLSGAFLPEVPAGTAVRPDRGESFVSKKLLKTGEVLVGIAGDSTGNASNEAFDLYMSSVAASDPALRVEIPHWNDVTQSYSAPVVVQEGIPEATGVVFLDTFSRVAADLDGSTPDIGEVWGRDGSSSAGDWQLDGSKAVRTSDTTSSSAIATVGTGDQTITASGEISTTNTGSQRGWRVYAQYLSSSNHLFAMISTSATGILSMSLNKRIANAPTVLTSVPITLPTNTAKVPFTLTVSKVGNQFTATVNGTTATATLQPSDLTALSAATMSGFSAGVLAGDSIDSFKVELLGMAVPPRKLTFYNASMSGSSLTYQQSRLASMFTTPLDLLFINSGHNYGALTPAQYEAALDDFISAFRELQPNAGIVISSQNPEKAPATNRVAHLSRLAALRSYCARHGYGYLPVIEKFKALPDGGVSLVLADGIHPTTGAPGTGSSLWRDVITEYFEALIR